MKKYTYRMMGLVPYQLSGIQKGIQFGHAVVEYMNIFLPQDDCIKWAYVDKTFIILNGGTTNDSIASKGTMNIHAYALEAANIKHAVFHEPDLGNQMTGIVWLADERVWDKEAYPDFVETDYITEDEPYKEWVKQFNVDSEEELEKILFLRNFTRKFRLA